MKIHVVTVMSGWILQHLAKRIADAGGFSIGPQPSRQADVNFYVDIQNCFHGRSGKLDMGMFTHVHADNIDTVAPVTFDLDYIFHMSRIYFDMFEKSGKFPPEKMEVLEPGQAPEWAKPKREVIGVFQRGGWEGKGSFFVEELVKSETGKKFDWYFVGKGWEDLEPFTVTPGEHTICTVPNEDYGNYRNLYNACDIVLIPSLWEGGPQCLIEALAMGKEVISADVGFVRQLASEEVEIFQPGDLESLKQVLEYRCEKIQKRIDCVKNLTHSRYAERIREVALELR